ncbi:hypothetical protein Y032_0001g405 [Ancylostoma ceylanicum]|uniref:Uncharacterized protein n=1 Tax=Ancylostoma ceylanicum TaxID=53326 RepID=A0A016W4A5_9BILA|nr:hypothetical protein Y032_0001g405 [Ancylostoma ceylanicum]
MPGCALSNSSGCRKWVDWNESLMDLSDFDEGKNRAVVPASFLSGEDSKPSIVLCLVVAFLSLAKTK